MDFNNFPVLSIKDAMAGHGEADLNNYRDTHHDHQSNRFLDKDRGLQTDMAISRFGHAAVQSGLSPDEAIVVYEDMSRALGGINLESDLHMVVTLI